MFLFHFLFLLKTISERRINSVESRAICADRISCIPSDGGICGPSWNDNRWAASVGVDQSESIAFLLFIYPSGKEMTEKTALIVNLFTPVDWFELCLPSEERFTRGQRVHTLTPDCFLFFYLFFFFKFSFGPLCIRNKLQSCEISTSERNSIILEAERIPLDIYLYTARRKSQSHIDKTHPKLMAQPERIRK